MAHLKDWAIVFKLEWFNTFSSQSYKHFTLVNYNFQGHNKGYFPVRYDSRVVIYDHKMFIRLATEVCLTKLMQCQLLKFLFFTKRFIINLMTGHKSYNNTFQTLLTNVSIKRCISDCTRSSLKNGPSSASFSFIFVFSNKHHYNSYSKYM